MQGMDKIMETLQILFSFFINMLPSAQLQSFLEWNRTNFEQSLAEFYTILCEEHQVALEMLEVGICSSLKSPKLTTVVQ
jgi:hypothetical protein